jgi:Tfp pilus assembly PilM family ATPase
VTSGRDEISSTEKLLDLIRSEQGQEENVVEQTVSSSPPAAGKPSFLSKFLSRNNKVSVGVDIGYNSFRLLKLRREGGSRWRLVARKSVDFDPSIDLSGRDFTMLFRKSFSDFCGSTSDTDIWCNISSTHVDVRYLHIPKVSAKQLEKAVYWAFRNEIAFDEQEMVLDFELRGEVVDKGIKKIGVLAYTAPHSETQARQDLFQRCRIPLTGITLLPFAMQNFFRTGVLPGGDEVVCNLYVGRKWSRIDIFFNGALVLVRGIKTGVESMAEALAEAVPEARIPLQKSKQAEPSSPADFSADEEEELVLELETTQEVEQEFYLKLTQEEAAAVLFSFSADGEPLPEGVAGAQLGREEVFTMILPAVDRLVRQIERTFDHYTSLFYGEPVSRIYISGRIQTYKYLTKYVSEQLGVLVSTVDPFDALVGVEGAGLSSSITDRSLFVPACGLALSSNNHTPNTLYTYSDRAITEKIKKAARFAFVGFFLATAVCVGLFFVQSWKLQHYEAKLAAVQMQLSTFRPRVNKEMINALVEDIKLRQKKLRDYSDRYMPLAAFSELSERTTDSVRLLGLKAYFGDLQEKEKGKLIKLDGFVSGDRENQELFLGEYLAQLAASRVLGEVERDGGKTNILDDREVFRFYARCRVE